MALNWFQCPVCGARRESFKLSPHCNHNQEELGEPVAPSEMQKILVAPEVKMLEPRSKDRGVSVLRNLNGILRERAKEHARLNDHHDFIQEKGGGILAKAQGWLNADGTKKKRVDVK